jgi:uncharacterized phage protein (TIGR01671 family)
MVKGFRRTFSIKGMKMREIKFRAWDRQRKRMLNDLVPFQESKMPSNWVCFYDVMQFTGLKDKNNKEIYEGDIIQEGVKGDDLWNGKATTDDAPIGEVIWDNNGLWNVKPLKEGLFHHQDENNKHRLYLSRYDGIFVGDWSKNCEVVGNIYENPELLEGK